MTLLFLLFSPISQPSLLLRFGPATVFRPASAQAYCASGAAFGTLVVAPATVPTLRFGDGCTLSSGEQLTLSGANMPTVGTAAAGAVEMRFSGGTVLSQGHIAVQGPTTAAAPTMVPMRVLITGSQFGDGAAVLVTGSYPPGSNITISFNIFVSQTRCALLSSVISTFVTVIAYAGTIPIVLGAGAEINTQYNSINTTSGTNIHSAPFVVSSITFNTGASASIKGNYIKTHGNNNPTAGNTWTIIFDTGPSYVFGNTERSTFRYLDGGDWRFDDNTVHVSNDNAFLALVGNSPYLTAAAGGTYSISRNTVVARPYNVTTLGDNSLFGFSAANNATNFAYRFDGNSIEGYGRNSVMSTLGLVLSGRSLVSVTNNTFISYGAEVGLQIVIGPTKLGGDSVLRIDGNAFTSPQGAARADAIVMTNTIRFDGNSQLSLVGNSCDAKDRTNTYKLFAAAAGSLSFAPTARAYACGTRYNGAPMRGRLLFNQFAADAAVGAAPIEHCASRTASATVWAKACWNETLTETLTRGPTDEMTTAEVCWNETVTPSPNSSTSGSASVVGYGTFSETVSYSSTCTKSNTSSVSARDTSSAEGEGYTYSISQNKTKTRSRGRRQQRKRVPFVDHQITFKGRLRRDP